MNFAVTPTITTVTPNKDSLNNATFKPTGEQRYGQLPYNRNQNSSTLNQQSKAKPAKKEIPGVVKTIAGEVGKEGMGMLKSAVTNPIRHPIRTLQAGTELAESGQPLAQLGQYVKAGVKGAVVGGIKNAALDKISNADWKQVGKKVRNVFGVMKKVKGATGSTGKALTSGLRTAVGKDKSKKIIDKSNDLITKAKESKVGKDIAKTFTSDKFRSEAGKVVDSVANSKFGVKAGAFMGELAPKFTKAAGGFINKVLGR